MVSALQQTFLEYRQMILVCRGVDIRVEHQGLNILRRSVLYTVHELDDCFDDMGTIIR